MNPYAYQQYKEQSINTMTNGEMLLLLYDELLKRLKRAELALNQRDYNLFDASVQRSTEIVQYLKDVLDRQYAISAQLGSMYDFFLYELSRIKAGRNPKTIEELKPLVEELRDAFRQAEKQTDI